MIYPFQFDILLQILFSIGIQKKHFENLTFYIKENKKDRFAKTSREAIKSLVSRALPRNTHTHTKNTKYAVNAFEGLAEFTQISFGFERRVIK